MYTFGTVFLVTAFLIMFVKENELKSVDVEDSEHLNLCSTYHMIWKMLHLAPVRKIGLVVMTCKVSKIMHKQCYKFLNLFMFIDWLGN